MEYTAARRFFQVLIQYKGKKIQSAELGAQNDLKLNLIANVLGFTKNAKNTMNTMFCGAVKYIARGC